MTEINTVAPEITEAPKIETKENVPKKRGRPAKEKIPKKLGRPKGSGVKPKKPKAKMAEDGVFYNEDGTPNKRATVGFKNLQQGAVYKAIQQAKIIKQQKKDSELESYYESSTEEEDEYIEVDPIILHPAKEPIIVEKEVERIVEKEVIREVVPEAIKSRITDLVNENQKIKDGMALNQFYNTIGIMSRKISIKQ